MGSGGGTSTTTAKIPGVLKPLYRTTAANVQELQRDAPLQPFLSPYTPQFTTTGGPGVTSFSPGPSTAAPATATSKGVSKEQQKLEDRLNKLFGKQAKKEVKGKGTKGIDKKIAKTEGLLSLFEPAEEPTIATGAPPPASAGPSETVPLRDVFTPTGAGIEEDPAIKAALEAYRRNVEPGLIDRLNLAGLGRSTAAADAIAGEQANLMLPLIQDALQREDTGIQREYNDYLRRQGLAENALLAPFGAFVPSTIGQTTTTSGGK